MLNKYLVSYYNNELYGSFLLLVIPLIFISIYHILFKLLRFWAEKKPHRFPILVNESFYSPGFLLALIFGIISTYPIISSLLTHTFFSILRHVIRLSLIASVAFLLVRVVHFIGGIINIYFDETEPDNLRARKVQTRFQLIERILTFSIIIITLGIAVMTFDKVKAIGTTILASAGIISIIVGFAAQKSLSTFIAGIQIAISQPIRIDDVVIVEGEWGRIEEITLTYIVVRIWDERCLIVPINYFIEKPFQNWTRSRADLLGSVFIYTDYSLPIQPIRNELTKILLESPLWDHRVNVLQVTNLSEKSMEVRALMSSSSSSNTFDLRCEVREKLISFIQTNFPQSLPVTRIEMKKE